MPAPAPLRLAAGLAVTAAEETFRLPYRIRRIPSRLRAVPGELRHGGEDAVIRVVGRTMTTGLRVQQQVNHVMAKGEVALGDLTGPEPTDVASWATFEDETPEDLGFSPADVAIKVGYGELDADDLEDLLEELSGEDISKLAQYEAAGAARPAHLTLLHNALDGHC